RERRSRRRPTSADESYGYGLDHVSRRTTQAEARLPAGATSLFATSRASRTAILAARVELVRALGVRRVARRRRLDRRYSALATDRSAEIAHAMWTEAAAALGADVRPLGAHILEFRLDGALARVSGQSTPFADPVSIRL